MSTAQITLYSGLPGNGKTAFVVAHLHKNAERWKAEGRQLYVHGIKDLTVEHHVLENPHKWHELPGGSIIVVDEAQQWFRPRHSSAAVPDYIQALETIRHSGFEMIVITQHPGLIDGNFKRLVGLHIHVERIFGGQSVTMFRWPRVVDPSAKGERRAADKSTEPLPSHIFSMYKSAEIHTIKRSIPRFVWYLLGVIIFTILGVLAAIYYVRKPPVKHTEAEASAPAAGQTVQPGQSGDKKADPLTWYQQRVPRLNGMPHTAPIYDGITTPTVAPKPVACVMTPKRCQCYSQKGTRMPTVDETMCRQIAENGYFDDSPEKQPELRTGDRQADRSGDAPKAAAIADVTGDGKKWPMGQPQQQKPPKS